MKRLAGLICILIAVGVAPVQLGAQAPAAVPKVVVRSGDVLRIRIWPQESLSGEFPIEETGNVYLPGLGPIQAANLDITELRDTLRSRYGKITNSPVVTITPLFSISVLGAVQHPGLYRVDPTQTFYDVISQAGGFKDGAHADRVRLIRGSEVIQLDGSGGTTLPPAFLTLRSGDRIIVPPGSKFSVRDVLWTLQSVALLITISRHF